MLKWLTIISAIIILSVIIYKFILYPSRYELRRESESETGKSFSVTYIVTSDVSASISIREIDTFTSIKNFPFTQYNMKPRLSRKAGQENI